MFFQWLHPVFWDNPRGYYKEKIDPLVLAWIDDDEPKHLSQGLFPTLVVHLLPYNCSPKFNLLLPQSNKTQCHNTIHLSWRNSFINSVYFLTRSTLVNKVSVSAFFKLEGINAIVDKFHYMHYLKILSSSFLVQFVIQQNTFVTWVKPILTCCKNDTIHDINKTCQVTWLRSVVKSEFFT